MRPECTDAGLETRFTCLSHPGYLPQSYALRALCDEHSASARYLAQTAADQRKGRRRRFMLASPSYSSRRLPRLGATGTTIVLRASGTSLWADGQPLADEL